jgi:hypothetical protein
MFESENSDSSLSNFEDETGQQGKTFANCQTVNDLQLKLKLFIDNI